MEDGSSSHNIVILGGSVGAIGCAHYLLRHVIKDLPGFSVILVSPNTKLLWRPACPRALVSEQFANDTRLMVPMSDIFNQYGGERLQHVRGIATSVDVKNRTAEVQLYKGDFLKLDFSGLIVATGASTTSPLLGLTGDDDDLRLAWKDFQQALSTAKGIVIGGGGAAGIETAGELGEMLNESSGWFRSAKNNVRIQVVTGAPQILPQVRQSIAETAESYLKDLGVEVVKNTKVVSVEPSGAGTRQNLTANAVVHLDNGSSIPADLYIPATGTIPNTAFMDRTLLAPDQRIHVEPHTLRIKNGGPGVYAIGDASTFARPTIHSILDAVPVLCANLKIDLRIASKAVEKGNEKDRHFNEDTRETQFVPIGMSRGVGALMGWRLPSWLVSLAKGRNYLLWASSGVVSGKQWSKP